MHSMERSRGAGRMGYVQGGMGQVSLALARAAEEAGAVIRRNARVAEHRPGDEVILDDGTRIPTGRSSPTRITDHAPVALRRRAGQHSSRR